MFLMTWIHHRKSYQSYQFLRYCCTSKWVLNNSDLTIFAVQVGLGIDQGVPPSQQQFHYLYVSSFPVPCRLWMFCSLGSFGASMDKGALRKSHIFNICWNPFQRLKIMEQVIREFGNSTGALLGNFLNWYFKGSFVRFSDGHKADHNF